MTAYVVLLRGVNLGPYRRVSAADLRGAAQDAGLADVRTLLTSGNLVVTTGTSGAGSAEEVARLVQNGLSTRLGIDVPAVALTTSRLADIVRANPAAGCVWHRRAPRGGCGRRRPGAVPVRVSRGHLGPGGVPGPHRAGGRHRPLVRPLGRLEA